MKRGDPRLPTSDQIATTGLVEWARRLVLRLYERFREIDEDTRDFYGEMYADNVTYSIVIAAANTWTDVGGGMTAGTSNVFKFQNSKELICAKAGDYMVWWAAAFETTGANDDIEGAVGINGTRAANTTTHSKVGTPNEEFALSSHGIITLAVGDAVRLMVNNNTDGDDLVLKHGNVLLRQIKE